MEQCNWTEIRKFGRYKTSCKKELPNMSWQVACTGIKSKGRLSALDFMCCPFCGKEIVIGG